jgi:hypothetical protein
MKKKIEELTTYANYLDDSDKRKLVVWLELLRNALQTKDIDTADRKALCKLMIKQCTPGRCKNAGAMLFYVPYALRCSFIIGDFSEPTLKNMKSLYGLLEQTDVIEVLDCHFFYHQLFGFPKKLVSILEYAETQASKSSSKVKSFLLAIKQANDLNNELLKGQTHLPFIETDSAWKKSPWLGWQLATMKNVI